MVKARIKAWKNFEKFREENRRIEYKRCIAIARRTIKIKKRENFKNFASGLSRFTNVSYVWKMMNTFKNRDNCQKWRKEGNKEYDEIVRREVRKVAPDWVDDRSDRIAEKKEGQGRIILDSNRFRMNGSFTMTELFRAIGLCRDKSSPGLDGIDYKMIKKLSGGFREKLLRLLNYAFLNS